MRKTNLCLLAAAAFAALTLSACELGGGGSAESVIIVTPTEEPAITVEPVTPVPTASPNLQGTLYTSPDMACSIDLPDTSWLIRSEESDRKSLESMDQGKIEIFHTQGAEDMAAVLLPDTEDLAVSMEKAAGFEEGTGFEIQGFLQEEEGPVKIFSYTVHYPDTQKSEGVQYALHTYYVTDSEYYGLIGSVRNETARAAIRQSMDTFKVTGTSPIAAVATGVSRHPEAASQAAGDQAAQPAGNQTGQASGDQTAGDQAGQTDTTQAASTSFTDEQLADTEYTRTIYRNSDGEPIVIHYDEANGWVDNSGNNYRFQGEVDVYDQNDLDYYWHGEAGDVAYMPVVHTDESSYDYENDYEYDESYDYEE